MRMKTKSRVETIELEAPRVPGQACCISPKALRLSDAKSQDLAQLFKALADPARLQILDLLSQQAGQICACDFEGLVGVPDGETGERPKQPTISHHLKVLREAGLIDCEKRGPWVYYFVDRARLARLKDVLLTLCCPPE